MVSFIKCGPIWGEILFSLVGKALLAGGLMTIKAGPKIKEAIDSVCSKDTSKDVSVNEVIDVFKNVK